MGHFTIQEQPNGILLEDEKANLSNKIKVRENALRFNIRRQSYHRINITLRRNIFKPNYCDSTSNSTITYLLVGVTEWMN